MKLKTSFFKPITLKKDIFRYAPIWALYLIGMVMLLLDNSYYQHYDQFANYVMTDLITAFGIVNLCYATLCAVMLFGDLYNTKLCYSLHAMPYRRESWLLTHLVSGLLFSLVPNCIVSLYLMAQLENYWFLALYWLLAVTLQYLFFFGIATVSALLTGNRFAMLLVTAGFNFIAMLIYATVQVLYLPMIEGVVANQESFSRFSPTVHLYNFDYFNFSWKEIVDLTEYSGTRRFYVFEGLADGWGYMAILAVVGLAAMALSVWLYRKRHLESAGDFVAFPKLKGLACIIMTLCVTLCMALLGEAMGSQYLLWLIVGLVIGYFGSLMLLERRLKVFRKKTFLGFGALVLAVAVSMLAIGLDWFGIEGWTPKASQVQSVTVSNARPSSMLYMDDYYYGNRVAVKLEKEEDIAQIILAHQDILERLDDEHTSHHRVTLTYKMKSGRTVVRSYYAPATGDGYDIVRRYLYSADSLLGFTNPADTASRIEYMYGEMGEIPQELYEKVLSALQTDCARGYVMADSGKSEYYIDYSFTDTNGKTVRRMLFIQEGAEIIALFKSPELAMGFTDWDKFLDGVSHVGFSSEGLPNQIPQEQWEGLLTALRKDIEAGTVKSNHYISNAIILYYEQPQIGHSNYREFYIPDNAEHIQAWLTEHAYIPA